MGKTQVRTDQVEDGGITRDDLNTAVAGKAVVRKIVQGTGVTLSSTGADAGTGDVTVNATAGRAAGIKYTFLTDTTNSDPGTGCLKFSGTWGNTMRISETDGDGNNIGAWISTWDDLVQLVRGYIFMQGATNPGKFAIFSHAGGGVTDQGAYDNVVININSSSGTFTNGEEVRIWFIRAGSDGATGPFGGAVSIPYVFSTTTTDADPGNGSLRLDNATQNIAGTIRADLLDALGGDWTVMLDQFNDSTNGQHKGYIRLVKTSDQSKWLLFEVASTASPSGYRNIVVNLVASSATDPFANGDAITLCFTRTGDVGLDGSPWAGSVLSLNRNGTNQTGMTGGAATKIQFTNVIVDSLSAYDNTTNFRFTPNRAGWYSFALQVSSSSNTETCQANIYKNGTLVYAGPYIGTGMGTGIFNSSVNALIFLNGSTDYVEFFVYLPASVTTLRGISAVTFALGFFTSS